MRALFKQFNDSRLVQILLFILFACIDSYLVANHVLCRDDARPILMANTINSFFELSNEVRYESTPMLYHLLLWTINKFVHIDVFVTKLLFLTVNISIVFFISFILKIPNIYRLLILVQVPQIGLLGFIRQYSLAVLLIFIFTHLYMKSKDKSTWIYIILFFLCQCCFHSMVCACGLYMFIISERYFQRKNIFNIKDLFIILGIILCSLQMIQPADIIEGLKEILPFRRKDTMSLTLHFLYDTLFSNPFSAIFFTFILFKTFNQLKSKSNVLACGFIVPIIFTGIIFYFISILKGYSNERHFWMLSYTIICLLLIVNDKLLMSHLKKNSFVAMVIFVIVSCIPFGMHTAKKDLFQLKGVINIAKHLDQYYPEKLTLQEVDFLSDAINIYRLTTRKYYSLNSHRFNFYVKWNHPESDFGKNRSNFFTIKASKLIKDIQSSPDQILNTEPIIIVTSNEFINDTNTSLDKIVINNKYNLVTKGRFPGSKSENFTLFQLVHLKKQYE